MSQTFDSFLTQLERLSRSLRHGRPYEKKSEESYFFRMSKYAPRLVEHIKANPSFVQPDNRRAEILAFLDQEINDLCISRTQCQWGVQCPEDPE